VLYGLCKKLSQCVFVLNREIGRVCMMGLLLSEFESRSATGCGANEEKWLAWRRRDVRTNHRR